MEYGKLMDSNREDESIRRSKVSDGMPDVDTNTDKGSSSSDNESDGGDYCRYFDPPIQLYTNLNTIRQVNN